MCSRDAPWKLKFSCNFQFLSDQDILVKEHRQQEKPVEEKPTEIEEHSDNLSEVDRWIYVPINPKPLIPKH